MAVGGAGQEEGAAAVVGREAEGVVGLLVLGAGRMAPDVDGPDVGGRRRRVAGRVLLREEVLRSGRIRRGHPLRSAAAASAVDAAGHREQSAVAGRRLGKDFGPSLVGVVGEEDVVAVVRVGQRKKPRAGLVPSVDGPVDLVRQGAAGRGQIVVHLFGPLPLAAVSEDHEKDGGGQEAADGHQDADDDGQVGRLPVVQLVRRLPGNIFWTKNRK